MADTMASAGGVRFHVQRLTPPGGSGASSLGAVVFVHGLLGNMSVFYYTLANHVAVAGYDVLLYDLRGHGMSECTSHGYLVEDMVADLEALLEVIEPDRPVHLVGYSLGGTIAQRLTVARPDLVDSLILVEGLMGPESPHTRAVRKQKWMVGEEDAATKVADALIARTFSEGSRWAAKARKLLTQTTFHADISGVRSTEPETAPLITRPTFVLSGDRSEFFAGADRTARLIPECTVHVLPGYDHDTILTEGAPLVRERVIAWLDGYRVRSADGQKGQSRCHASFS
jgi:pimeloyl-ACP methyl ester carboxylesterase